MAYKKLKQSLSTDQDQKAQKNESKEKEEKMTRDSVSNIYTNIKK